MSSKMFLKLAGSIFSSSTSSLFVRPATTPILCSTSKRPSPANVAPFTLLPWTSSTSMNYAQTARKEPERKAPALGRSSTPSSKIRLKLPTKPSPGQRHPQSHHPASESPIPNGSCSQNESTQTAMPGPLLRFTEELAKEPIFIPSWAPRSEYWNLVQRETAKLVKTRGANWTLNNNQNVLQAVLKQSSPASKAQGVYRKYLHLTLLSIMFLDGILGFEIVKFYFESGRRSYDGRWGRVTVRETG